MCITKAPTVKDTSPNIKNRGSFIFIFLNIILLNLLYHKTKNRLIVGLGFAPVMSLEPSSSKPHKG
jgi:hypothetical protein